MRKILFMLPLLAGMILGTSFVPAQDKAPDKAPVAKIVKHWKGRVAPDPKVLKMLYEKSDLLHKHHLKALPKATAAVYDCRVIGLVPPIVNQAQCGSCWDFSGTCVAECALIKAGVLKADGTGALSEQYTLDCGRNGGCNGDDNTTVLAWAKLTGLPLTSAYGPYQGRAEKCKSTSSMTLYKISDWGFCTTGDTEGVAATQDIKNAMVAYGPIGAGVDAEGSWWNSGTGTDTDNGRSIDHDVVIVGWDDTHDNGDKTTGAWIMRNSWDVTWGTTCANTLNPSPKEAGYGWVKYGASSLGTEACWATATAPAPLPGVPAITSALAVSGTVGTPISYQVVATNSPTAYASVGLPAGLTIIGNTGLIAGTPTTVGVYTTAVSASNSAGVGASTITFTISATPTPTPVPPIPPTPGQVTVILTPDQVAKVIADSGVLTFDQAVAAIKAAAQEQKKNAECPACGK